MLYNEESVRANIRNRDGKRVFYLHPVDTLTPSARDYLRSQGISVLPAEQAKPDGYFLENGAIFSEKPEHYTHLRGNILVPKTHPIIAFRGAMDTLEAELLLAQVEVPENMQDDVGQILSFARQLIRREVMQEPVEAGLLCGLTQAEQRHRSQFPQEYYGIAHFMPTLSDGKAILWLNRARTAARHAELTAASAFVTPEGVCLREDLLRALNRISSMLYILMLRLKSGR